MSEAANNQNNLSVPTPPDQIVGNHPLPPPPPLPPAKTNKKWLILAAAAILLIGVISSWLVLKKDKSKPVASEAQLTKVNVHLGWLNQAQFAGFYVAKDKGYYKAAGLDVNL